MKLCKRMPRSSITFRHLHKGNNLVCNELTMLQIPDDVSEALFNVLDKVCITFGTRENSSPDGELTYPHL